MFKKIIRNFKRRNVGEINPDEIFIDSSNLPKFDVDQFEGRLEQPISLKTVAIMSICFALVGGVFLSRFWFLQIHRGEAFAIRSEANRLRHIDIFSNRGVIFDRNGVELASNARYGMETGTSTVQSVGMGERTASASAGATEELADFAKRVYAPVRGIGHLVGYLKYPLKDSAGFYSRTSYLGQDGVEKTYDELLSGENGDKIIETDAHGKIQSQSVVRGPVDGQSLTLTIDSRINDKLYEIMERSSKDYGFTGGAAAIMDVESGELLSLMSFPEYSSSALTEGDREQIKVYQTDPQKPFLNRAISGIYTPGSIVKPLMAIGALTEGVISPNTQIYSSGSITVPNKYFPDKPTVFNDWKAHGWVDMRRAIAVSSNVYFFEVGGGFEDQPGMGIANIEKYLRMFGLGEKTGIKLIGESNSVIPNPEWKEKNFDGDPWRVGDTYNTSIGQYGMQFTPIQAARYVTALANDGTLFTPRLIHSVGTQDNPQPIEEGKTTHISLSKDHFRIAKEGMRMSVTDGLSASLNVPYVEVAAKTGTAELGTRKEFVNSWTIGFFPYNKPKYAFAVVMERGPRSNLIGAIYVMRQLLDWMNENTPEYLN